MSPSGSHDEHRVRMPFKVRLRFDEYEWGHRYTPKPDGSPNEPTWRRGDVVEVDEVGDDPKTPMAVRDLVIAGTDHPLDYDEYEILDNDEMKGEKEGEKDAEC